MKISLTNWEQTLICMSIVYALDFGFLSTSSIKDDKLKEYQKIIDKMTINTPLKSGECNSLTKLK